jgi:hypothetical protein
MRQWRIAIALPAAFAIAVVALPGVAKAAPPGNDNFDNATVISSLPFSDSVDMTEATTEFNEPQPCIYLSQTVWYAVTPAATGLLHVDPQGSSFPDGGEVNIYQANGSGLTGLSFLTCAYNTNRADVSVQAGQTYYIQAGPTYYGTGTLQLRVSESLPPSNDDFENATPIPTLPFSDTLDTTLATTAPDDPFDPCVSGQGSGSVWYTGTAGANFPVGLDTYGTDHYTSTAVYTGTRGALTLVGCSSLGANNFGFQAVAGTTYYIEVVGYGPNGGSAGQLQFHVRQGPTVTGFAINKAASVNNASGVAKISGTISCDLDATATISGTLRQKLNRYTVITGTFSITTSCSPGGNAWSAQVVGNNGPYGGGQAGADATGTACLDPNGYGGGIICTSLDANQTVSLRGGH